MPATPYKPVSWANNEPISKTKLDQMVNNDQYLFENMPRIQFSAYGIKKTNSVKVLAGIAVVPASNTQWSWKEVQFGSYFSSGCKPVIVTGNQRTGTFARFHSLVEGISGYYPDYRGMKIGVWADYYGTSTKNVVGQRVYIHYIAIGW